MKKIYIMPFLFIFTQRILRISSYICLLFSFATTQAQTWQWGKRGGNAQAIYGYETVISNCTDVYGNIYLSSEVGPTNLNIDGVPKPTYSSGNDTDCLITSFSCDGSYRWSKVIGGAHSDVLRRIGTDSHGNIFAVGQVSPVDPTQNAIHFDTDLVLPRAYSSQNLYNQSMFLVKYDSNGNFKWLRMPQPSNVTLVQSIEESGSLDLQVDSLGNSYWLCILAPGSYGNGAFVVTTPGTYIMKYDTDGAFISGTALDFQTSPGKYNLKMERNHNTGTIYITGRNDLTDPGPITAGGQTINHSLYLCAFNSDGSLLWTRENASIYIWQNNEINYDLAIDSDNSIYLTGTTGWQNADTAGPPDSFNGVPFTGGDTPWPFITKLTPAGDTVWQTNGNRSSPCEIVVNGNEVAVSGAVYLMQWQNLSYQAPNPGLHPFLIRFNKTSGSIIAINTLQSTGGGDQGTALSVDGNGSYYMGGKFTQTLTAGSSTMTINGSESDFFIAKFGSDNCDFLGTVNPVKESLQGFPNPVKTSLQLNNKERCGYVLYGILGTAVQTGIVEQEGVLSFEQLASGIYILQLEHRGDVKRIKVVKE
jgi:hypothetical protein